MASTKPRAIQARSHAFPFSFLRTTSRFFKRRINNRKQAENLNTAKKQQQTPIKFKDFLCLSNRNVEFSFRWRFLPFFDIRDI